ncbi:hypothetical protein LV779_08565 [Streptomyces thinghirensis]|nr:hypothetical protein [Streptomyces thinghirensis]
MTNAATTGLFDARECAWSEDSSTGSPSTRPCCRPCATPADPAGTLPCRTSPRTYRPRHRAPRPSPSPRTTPPPPVAAVLATEPHFAWPSRAVPWSLAGLELDAPVLTEAPGPRTSPTNWAWTAPSATSATSWACGCSRSAAGPGKAQARPQHIPVLLAGAARCTAFGAVIDPDGPGFLRPGRHAGTDPQYCRRTD